jgi:hypothetical protein
MHRPFDDWLVGMGGKLGIAGVRSFPRNTKDKKHYWEMYEGLMASVAPPVLHLNMADLNESTGKIKEFLSG